MERLETFFMKRNYVRVGLLHLICLEQLYGTVAGKEDYLLVIIIGEVVFGHNKVKYFQDKKWL